MEVEVETLEKGLMIKIWMEKNSHGLLVSILEAFEEVGMEVLEARVSCSDSFHLQALGRHNNERNMGRLDGESVKQAVILAVENLKDNNESCDQNDQEDHAP